MARFFFCILFWHLSLAPAFGQICPDYSGKNQEEESPVQRVGTARRDSDLELSWFQPADFTEIRHFRGEAYQLADHEGVDFIHTDPSVAQVPVYAAARGTVVYVRRGCPQSNRLSVNTEQRGCGSGWGNHVVIRHANGLWTRYAHLYPDSIQVRVLQQVDGGQALAKMGNSGQSNTRHLHFELGVAIEFNSCALAQSFAYVYDPIIHLEWFDLGR